MNANLVPAFTLPAILLLATAASAQTVTSIATRSATHAYAVGDTAFGAQAQIDASGRRELTRLSLRGLPVRGAFGADVAVDGTVQFRGASYPVAGVTGEARLQGGITDTTIGTSWTAETAVRLANFTVYQQDFAGSAGRDFDLWSMQRNLSLFDVTIPYPLPLGLSGDVRFRAGLSLDGSLGAVVDPVAMGVGLDSAFKVAASGTVSASISAWCVDVGVAADLRLLETTVAPTLEISNANGFEGGFNATCAAVRILVRLFWSACGLAEDSHPLFDRSYGSVTANKILQ